MDPTTRRRSCAVLGIALLSCTPCCSTSSARGNENAGAQQIRATYQATFKRMPADYVIITYPGKLEWMPGIKQVEHKVLQEVLDELEIQHVSKPYAEVLVTFEGKISGREHFAFDLPENIAQQCRNGTVVYVHLGLKDRVKTFSHPISLEYGIKVQYMCDPIRLSVGA